MVVCDTKRVIALIGIVVVDTPDALLITITKHAQQVKKTVESLHVSGDTDVL